ncbi:MAG: DUF1178 family protein [Comamonadaceae bacterium]|nr:DUF1178 family protein [Comamonadaceae bacterium]
MKVLDLQCAQGHVFEGWFASEDEFQNQRSGGLLTCPVCNEVDVIKLPSAPRLNLGAAPPAGQALAQARAPTQAPEASGHAAAAPARAEPSTAAAVALQAAWMKAVRRVMAETEDVSERFAEEARRMHYGETAERGIRGQASAEETAALLDEGIAVLPLPLPAGFKGPLQ